TALTRVADGMTRLSAGRRHPTRASSSATTTRTAFATRNLVVGITIPNVWRAHSCQPVRYSSATWKAQDTATTQRVHSLVVSWGTATSSPPWLPTTLYLRATAV